MLSNPALAYTFSMRSRTSSGAPACLNSSLAFSGSRSPSAHWPSLRGLFWAPAGRAVVIRGFSFANVAGMDALLTGFISVAQIRQPAGRRCGSTASRQTATAANALEIDVPPHHQRDARAGLGGDHGPILPWIHTSYATRSKFVSR